MSYAHGPLARRTVVVEQKGKGFPNPKTRQWSHQDDLKALLNKKVTILFLDDTTFNGTLLAADQFTVKIELSDASASRVFFKSALQGFWEVK